MNIDLDVGLMFVHHLLDGCAGEPTWWPGYKASLPNSGVETCYTPTERESDERISLLINYVIWSIQKTQKTKQIFSFKSCFAADQFDLKREKWVSIVRFSNLSRFLDKRAS